MKRNLRIGVIGSGASSQKLTRLLAEQGLSVLHAIAPSDIEEMHISARDIDVWLLDLADADWNDALDDLMDRSSVPIFFNEHGAVDKQQHLDYWSRNLIARIHELVNDSDLEPPVAKSNETLHIGFPEAKALAAKPLTVAPVVTTAVEEHLLDDIAELESLLQQKPGAPVDHELQNLVAELAPASATTNTLPNVEIKALDKAEAAKLRAEKMMRERAEAETAAHINIEQDPLAQQRAAQEAALAAQQEAERLALEAAEAARKAAEKVEVARRELARLEAERLAREKAEAEKREAERLEAERIAREKAEAERLAREKAEAEKREAARLEAERIAQEKAEAERLAREKAEAEKREAERLEAERIAREKAEAERLAREKAEAEKREAARLEAERIAHEKAEAERLAREKAEAEKREAERLEAERIAREKAEAEKREAARLEAERIAHEKAEAERFAREKAEAEKVAAEKTARDKANAERALAEKEKALRMLAEKAEQARQQMAEKMREKAEQAKREQDAREQTLKDNSLHNLENVSAPPRPFFERVIDLHAEQTEIEQRAQELRADVAVDNAPASLENHELDNDAPLLESFALDGEFEEIPRQLLACDLWVLGASLGGPAALKRFFAALVEPIPVCFVVAQHIDAHFVAVLGKIIEQSNSFYHVQVLSRPSLIEAGWTLLVPIEKRLRFLEAGQIVHSAHNWTPPYSPCIDDVLLDAVNAYHNQVHCIIFSGMGEDGAAGARRIRQQGGEVWVQDRDSCASSVMPDAIVQQDLASYQGTPELLAQKLIARYRNPAMAQTRA